MRELLQSGEGESPRVPELKLVSGSSRRLMVLAPSEFAASRFFNHVHADSQRHEDFLAELQRLRGSVYLQDGAIRRQQLIGGRHQLGVDHGSWHLLTLDNADRVVGCIRCRQYPNNSGFWQLGVSQAALAGCREWGQRFKEAVEAELAFSRRLCRSYAEVGGWALTEAIRGTTEALRLVLASFALAEALGGWVVITTATSRNSSASILKRIGGQPLQHEAKELPAYHDPTYRCEMEILRFYSWAPNPRFRNWIDEIKTQLRSATVLVRAAAESANTMTLPLTPHSVEALASYG